MQTQGFFVTLFRNTLQESTSMREQQLAKQRMTISKNDHILAFGEVFETSLTSWNSFIICFATLLTLCCTWLTMSKVHAMPTNSNANMSPVGSIKGH